MHFGKNNSVKLRLLMDIPVGKKYGLTKGREIVAYPETNYHRGRPRWWYFFQVDRSPVDHVGILSHEAEVIE